MALAKGARAPHGLCALCALCVLCAATGASAVVDHCIRLQNLAKVRGWGGALGARALTERGAPRRLTLAGAGAAPRAAHALLRALLVHALHYSPDAIVQGNNSALHALSVADDFTRSDEFILSVASAWQHARATPEQCMRRVCGVAGARLEVLGRGAAPVERRLMARLARGAPGRCLRDWDTLRTPECGFLAHCNSTSISDCANHTYSPGEECVTVVVSSDEDEQDRPRACNAARRAAALKPPLTLRFESRCDAELRDMLRSFNRSFLFLDYDVWEDGATEHVWPAPALPRIDPAPAISPVSLLVGDARKLTHYASPVLHLALSFQPRPVMLRKVLAAAAELGPEEAACQVAFDYKADVDAWLACPSDFCERPPHIRVYICGENDFYVNGATLALETYQNISGVVEKYWETTFNQKSRVIFDFIPINCSDVEAVNGDVLEVTGNFTSNMLVQGVVATGAAGAGAGALRESAARGGLPLLLAGAAPGAPLAAAVRALLAHCGWRRLVLLLEEDRGDEYNRTLGAEPGLAARALVVRAGAERAALAALRALRARVALVATGARAAARLLRAARRARGADCAWLLLGAAADTDDRDWLPTDPEFSYVTISESWRGGPAPRGLGGAAALRAALEAARAPAAGAGAGAAPWAPHAAPPWAPHAAPPWAPHAAPFADAVLLMLEARRRALPPRFRHDSHHPDLIRWLLEMPDNVTGVTYTMRANSSPPVFAHRWGTDGARLAGVWDAHAGAWAALEPLCYAHVRDADVCYTTSSGDPFAPTCHDFAYAVLACVLALGPPAALAARAARRRHLQRRDRRVEQRALLRGGHSAADAAASTALAEHGVARSALQLLDELGSGHYGTVRQAVLRRPGSAALSVAAKAPRADAPAGAAAELLREAALLASLHHDHVVRFAGVCWEGGPLVLMEHAFHGDLRRYLRSRRPLAERARDGLPDPEEEHVAAPALTRLAREAAAALGYLAHRRLVHRDVRAANCLVDARRSLKLADFGLARRLDEEDSEYLCRRRAMFPVLWMAPEALTRGVFTAASDVWALGVLLLELATLGERPYGAWPARRVVQHVCAGGAPPLPRDSAPCTRGVAAACWRRAAHERPAAAELVAYLAANPRAVRPALEPLPGVSARATPDSSLYVDEWTVK